MKLIKYIFYYLLGAWRYVFKKKGELPSDGFPVPGMLNVINRTPPMAATPVIIHKIHQMEIAHKQDHPDKALEIEITFDELKDLFMSVEVTSSYYYIIKSILQGDVKSFLYGSTKITLSKFPDVITEQLK